MNYFVGVDVGGTTSTIAISDSAHRVLYLSDQFPTQADRNPAVLIEAIIENIRKGMEDLDKDVSSISAIGLATPGPATRDGILLKTPNLKPELWDRFPIRAELESALHQESLPLNVHYIGDGQAAALGEYWVRKGKVDCCEVLSIKPSADDFESLVMVIVGTGLGGGEVLSGQVARGKEGRAGHIGHTFLPDFAFRYEHDRRLQVGNATSTVESAVSLTALTHQLSYRLTLDQWKDHPLNSDPAPIGSKAKRLRQLAGRGDSLALELFDDQAKALGIALLSVNYVGDFDRIVIGGGVCDLDPEVRTRYSATAENTYREFALDGFKNDCRFEFSICGDEAPVIGSLINASFAQIQGHVA